MSEKYTFYVDNHEFANNVEDVKLDDGVLVIYYTDGSVGGIRNWGEFYLTPNEENDD